MPTWLCLRKPPIELLPKLWTATTSLARHSLPAELAHGRLHSQSCCSYDCLQLRTLGWQCTCNTCSSLFWHTIAFAGLVTADAAGHDSGTMQANWMKQSGIKKGDAVAIYLPMVSSYASSFRCTWSLHI